MSDSETKTITAEVPVELLEQVDRYAALCDRPRDWVINEALQTWLSTEEEKDALTRDAMASVDAGLTIDHAEVRAWVESWDTEHELPMPVPKPR